MKSFFWMIALGAVALMFSSPAAAEVKEYKLNAAESKIKFSVSATVYTIRGTASQAESRVSFDAQSGTVNLPMKIEIPVDSMKTKNKLRDKDMRKMFDSKQFPVILWTAEEVECAPRNTGNAFACTGKGILTIKGQEKKVIFPVDLLVEEKGIRATGLLTIKREDYGLKTPSMLGMVRVGKEVTIEFDTVWN